MDDLSDDGSVTSVQFASILKTPAVLEDPLASTSRCKARVEVKRRQSSKLKSKSKARLSTKKGTNKKLVTQSGALSATGDMVRHPSGRDSRDHDACSESGSVASEGATTRKTNVDCSLDVAAQPEQAPDPHGVGDRTQKSIDIAARSAGGSDDEPLIPEWANVKAFTTLAGVLTQLGAVKLVIEIFAGCARFSGACVEKGLNIFVPIERNSGPWADTDRPEVQALILLAIERGLIWYIHLATECKMWSRARTTSTKAVSFAVVWFTLKVLRHAQKFKVHFSIENPYPSPLFDWPPLVSQLEVMEAITVRFDCCAFGATYRKMSQFRTNFKPLQALGKQCKDLSVMHLWLRRCFHCLHVPISFPLALLPSCLLSVYMFNKFHHMHYKPPVRCCGHDLVFVVLGMLSEDLPRHIHPDTLEGTVAMHGQPTMWKTTLASKYVPKLCREWAAVLATNAPPGAFGQSQLNQVWQAALMQVTGTLATFIPEPTCPHIFTTGWHNSRYTHRTSTCVQTHLLSDRLGGSITRVGPQERSHQAAHLC